VLPTNTQRIVSEHTATQGEGIEKHQKHGWEEVNIERLFPAFFPTLTIFQNSPPAERVFKQLAASHGFEP